MRSRGQGPGAGARDWDRKSRRGNRSGSSLIGPSRSPSPPAAAVGDAAENDGFPAARPTGRSRWALGRMVLIRRGRGRWGSKVSGTALPDLILQPVNLCQRSQISAEFSYIARSGEQCPHRTNEQTLANDPTHIFPWSQTSKPWQDRADLRLVLVYIRWKLMLTGSTEQQRRNVASRSLRPQPPALFDSFRPASATPTAFRIRRAGSWFGQVPRVMNGDLQCRDSSHRGQAGRPRGFSAAHSPPVAAGGLGQDRDAS